MRKVQIKVSDLCKINPSIKAGDKVYIKDGSSLSPLGSDETVYIVDSYPHLTGVEDVIKNIEGVVVQVGIEDCFLSSVAGKSLFRQDILVCFGKGLFYCSSGCVVVS